MFFVGLLICSTTLSVFMSSCASSGLTGQAALLDHTIVKPDQIKANFDFNLKQKRVGEAKATYFLGLIKLQGDNKYSDVKGLNIGAEQSGILGTATRIINSTPLGSKIEKVKSAAVYNAIKESDADLIVNPQFETETNPILFGLFKTYKVKVKTYEAKIKEIYQEKEVN